MSRGEKIFYWLPRILSIAFVLFLSLFALDVFNEYSGWSIVLPLLIHLIPSFVLAGALAIAWKHEWFGAVIFLGFAVFYVWMVGLDRPWSWYAGISAPSAVVGILYIVSWVQRKKKQKTPKQK
jgi:hypothetical protein